MQDPAPHLVLTVPCYNEAKRLDERAFLDFASAHPHVSLVFVDDGSTDTTGEILNRLTESAPGSISALYPGSHQGKAAAVRHGILEGLGRKADLVGFWDADLSTPLRAVDDFLALLRKRPEVEVVLGSRVAVMGRDIRRQAWRHYIGRVFATAVSVTLDLPVYDTQCGAKVFRANDAIAGVFAAPFRNQWVFDVEVLERYLSLPVPPDSPPRRSRIYELVVPQWHHAPGSKLRPWHFIRATFDLACSWRGRSAWTHQR